MDCKESDGISYLHQFLQLNFDNYLMLFARQKSAHFENTGL